MNTRQATVSFDASGRLLIFIQVRFVVILLNRSRSYSLGGLRLCVLQSTHWFQWKWTSSTSPIGAQTQTRPVYYGVGLWSELVWTPYFVSYRVSLWLISYKVSHFKIFRFLMELFCSRGFDAIELHLSSCNSHKFFVFFWEGSLECSCGSKGGNNVAIILKEALCPQAYQRTQRKANRHWHSMANLPSWSGNLVWVRDHMFVWCHRPLRSNLKTHRPGRRQRGGK